MAIEGLTKRKYKFRSKNKGGKWGYTLAIIISIVAYLLIWFYL
jgi:uncharacterized membrane protein HdeD (DUF308 family)